MAKYVPTYTFTNGTTADGGQVEIEKIALGTAVNSIANEQIASDAAIAISKTTLTYTASTAWTTTPTGWSGTPTQDCTYERIGKKVFCYIKINGTSNATTKTFTVPVAAGGSATNQEYYGIRAYMSGGWLGTPTLLRFTKGSTTVNAYYEGSAISPWVDTGPVEIAGYFFYECA